MRALTIVALFLAGGCSSHNGVSDVAPQQIAPSTYVIHGPTQTPNPDNRGFMNNPAFIVSDQGVIVIDPGGSRQTGEMVLRQIRKVTDQPVTHVFNTHVHGDHWLGNQAIVAAYPHAVIYAHPDMIRVARAGEGERWVALMERMTDGATHGTEPVFPNHSVNDGQTLVLDGKTFRIYAPPHAHSGTDIMIHFIDEDVVFCGDNASNQRSISLDDATFAGNIAALQLAISLKAQHYVPGHGPSGGVEVAQHYLTYLQTVYNAAQQGVDEMLDLAQMKTKLRPRLSAYANWYDFDTQLGRHLSLAQIEVEQKLFQ